MMKLRTLLISNYKNRYHQDYIYTKRNGVYEPITFGTLIENAVYLARALLDMGLKGARIIVYGDNSVEWMIADIAIMAFVGINIGIDREWKCSDVKNTISFLNADAVIYSDTKRETIQNLKAEFLNVRFISMNEDFESLIEKGKSLSSGRDLFDFEERSSEECIRVVFSSGTISFPKAVMLSDTNIFSGWDCLKRRAPMDENDVCYLFLPLHHTYAGIYNFLYSLISGLKIYISTSTDSIAAELQEVNPTVFCGVPIIYRRFFEAVGGNHTLLKQAFGNRIRYLFCGGAYLDESIRAEYRNAGLNLLIAYALSETASSFAIEYSGSQNTKSVGTVYEDIDVIIAKENGNGEGEICVKGNNVFLGYLNNDEATKAAFDAEGYFHTGDMGRLDSNGDLYLVGRKKRVIIMDNGENIYPENIEMRICQKCDNINSVRVYLHDSELKATIYLKQEDNRDYAALMKEINAEAVKNEYIGTFEVLLDSVDKRMKQ